MRHEACGLHHVVTSWAKMVNDSTGRDITQANSTQTMIPSCHFVLLLLQLDASTSKAQPPATATSLIITSPSPHQQSGRAGAFGGGGGGGGLGADVMTLGPDNQTNQMTIRRQAPAKGG